MSDMSATIRRAYLSCTSLVRRVTLRACTLAGTFLATTATSFAQADADDAIETGALLLDRQEIVALTIGGGILAFTIVATALLMQGRIRATKTETRLRRELQTALADRDRLQALLFVEPQVMISWSAGEPLPTISGDTAALMSELLDQHQPHRVLAFGTWLPPDAALQMDHAADALLEHGVSFSLNMTTSRGLPVEAMGRAIGGQAIIRIRELSGLRRELDELTVRHRALADETYALKALAAAAPWPMWAKRNGNELAYVNEAYAKAVDASDVDDALSRNLELIDSEDRATMALALASQRPFTGRMRIVAGGERRPFDVFALKIPDGSVGIAIDASEANELSNALQRMADAHRRTLDQLSSGVAVFDGQRRLAFYNDSYRRLWNLDRNFLDSHPDDSSVLDRLRAARKVPEQSDFRSWKQKLHEAYHAIEPAKDVWYLPDGRAVSVVTTPNPEGGVTYLFDDVTERLDLARRYDALIRVQRESLDNLNEAVAVFGSNGRAELFNPAFVQLWKLSDEALAQKPHIETVEQWCRPLLDDDAIWQTLRNAITGIDNREPVPLKITQSDGTVLNCLTMPLPDGATMLTFHDISDAEKVERMLRERNEALNERNEALKQRNQALEAADKIKIDFVHHVSYELRSPLTNVIGFAHFLSDPSTGPLTPKQSEYLGYITSSTDALMAIIDNILALASIDAGALTLNLGPVDIREAITSAARGVQDRLVRDRLTLRIDAPTDIGTFVGDEQRIIQVLYNLLSNAVGFSPPDGDIHLSARRNNDTIIFRISDSGPGIAPDKQDKVFNWFETDNQGSRHRGAGLGLSLVRSFVQLHGGRIAIDSAVGKGTTVTCEFPVTQTTKQSDAAE